MGKTHKEQNKEYYNSRANIYDESHMFTRENRNHYKKIEKIVQLLQLKNEQKVLEIGVGTGIHAEYVMNAIKGIKYYGIDLSKGMIKEAEKRLKKEGFKNFYLTVDDAENLSFKDNYFDAVYISGTLHHLTNPRKGIQEMVRVLKKGGKIVAMEPNKYFFKNYLQARFIKVEKNVLQMKLKNFKKWAKETNLKKIKMDYFIYTLPWPKSLLPFYDWLDDLLPKVPLFRYCSIMLYFFGIKK